MVQAQQAGASDVDAGAEFKAMISDRSVAPSAMADFLEGLEPSLRTAVVRDLGRRDQKTLYERVDGFAPVTLVDLVPPDRPDLVEVRHLGRNTLPAFRIFEKRFCRLPGSSAQTPDRLAGYNFQAFSVVTGPGYYLAREDENEREVLIDYTRLPDEKPADWPAIRSNERGLARFVYGFMVDRLRRVSETVTVGSAIRNGRELGSYFVLDRAD